MFVKQTNNLEALSAWPFPFQKNGAFSLMKMATYLLKFMQKHQIVEVGKPADYYIGVSGGADSMALLSLLWAIGKLRPQLFQSLTIIHINHGTRAACQEEQDFVERTAKQLGIKFKAHKLSLELGASNFEMRARDERYGIFRSYLDHKKAKSWFYLAHQLDDSFEWSLLQSFKSSNPASNLGIPLVNGAFARPLLCLSRQQILNLARAIGLPYRNDVSNLDPKFERGYLRQKIIPSIKERYPQYLANYVTRSNHLAHLFKVHRLKRPSTIMPSLLLDDGLGGKLLLLHGVNNEMDRIEPQLRRGIEQLSSEGRGRLRNQIARLFEAYGNHKIGPIHFSGGVLAYLLPGVIHLVAKQKLSLYQAMDHQLATQLSEPIRLFSSQSLQSNTDPICIFPMIVRRKLGKRYTAMFGHHPLFEETSTFLRQRPWKLEKAEGKARELDKHPSSWCFILTKDGKNVLRDKLQILSTMTVLELSPGEF